MAENVNTPVQASDANAAVVNIGGAAAAAAPAADAAAKNAQPSTGLKANRAEAFQQLSSRLKGLPLAQKAILGGGVLFLLLVILFTSFSGMKDDYKILFSNVDERDSAAIVASLQQMNVPYKFTEGGGAITVPAKTVHETRLKLAGQGLPKSGFVGFELLENQRLGTSQFVEQVNYQRGLEGELAKSISSLSLVKSARVHLAVPKQSAFVREQQRPTASVVLTLHPGRFLDKQQATAITHLVGSSVPQMGPQDVTILDSEGNLLSPSADRAEGLNQSQLKYVQELEAALSKRVASILEPITGKGNVKAQVTLDMDFNELARTQEAFGRNTPPNAAAIRSQQSISAEGTTPSTGGIPGALTNQPPPNAQAPIQKGAAQKGATGARVLNAPGDGGSGSTSRNELTTNYEVDRTIEYLKRAKGELRRVSAAVVVNFKSQTDTKSGEVKLIPYQPAEVQQMIALARDAVGFRQDRGDSVSLANIPFTPEPVEQVPFYKDAGFIELSKEFAKFAIIIGALAIFFFVVAKPILFPPLVEVVEEEQKLEDEIDERMKAELAMMTPEIREKKRLEMELQREKKRMEEEERRRAAEDERRMAEEERKRKAEEAQREYEELVQYAKDFVAKDPRVVANVFKGWMSTDAKAAG
ncbi:MAG: flagellar basal body M-ring protein FliF [Burkholderiaceae bacterium]|nr:flagellar basal body M-ring protein FliF [Burkholderiaceae bacterium]